METTGTGVYLDVSISRYVAHHHLVGSSLAGSSLTGSSLTGSSLAEASLKLDKMTLLNKPEIYTR